MRIWGRKTDRPLTSASEPELIRLLGQDSDESMAEIYRRCGAVVFRFSVGMLHDESIAEEVTQEVFLTLLNQSSRFDAERGALSTWLCGIARRLIWKQLRLRQRDCPMPPDDELYNLDGLDEDACEVLTRKEALLALDREIAVLPSQFREVVILCELEEMKYEDVAAVLGLPIGTVRSRLYRAKRRLAQALKADTVKTSGGAK